MIQLHSNTIARRLLFFPVFFLFSISSLFAGEEKTDIDYTQYLTSDSAFAAYLRAHNIAITNNNKLELLSSGRKKFASLFSEIKKAKHHVHLEYFNFRNDSIGNALFNLLAQKAQQGVEVRAMFDAFGNMSNNKPLKKQQLKQLREEGIEIVSFDPITFPYVNHVASRDHQKIAVIDGITSYTGGMNIADYYINGLPEIGAWRDMHISIKGPASEELQKAFLFTWNKETQQHIEGKFYFPIDNDSLKAFPQHAGGQVAIVQRIPNISPKAMRQAYVAAIDAAKYKVQIINPYFTPTRSVRRALKRAAARGVRVEIMIPGKSDITFTPDAAFYTANNLRKKGLHIYIYNGGFHHSKVMMVDDRFCTVGSTNLNSRSLRYDYEINAFIFDLSITDQLVQIFQQDKQNSTILTKEEYAKRSPWKRFVGWFAHLFIPVL